MANKKLSTPRILAKYKEAITVKEADNVTLKEDITMLKDHEVLIDDDLFPGNELLTVKKAAKDSVANSIEITRQIDQVINELEAEGVIQLSNRVFGYDIDLLKQKSNQSEYITLAGNVPMIPYKFTTSTSETPVTGGWNDEAFLYDLLGIRAVLLSDEGKVVKVFKNINSYDECYDPSDTTFSNPESYDPTSTTYDGLHIMIQFKKLWIKQWKSSEFKMHVRFSPDPMSEKDGWMIHPAFLSERTQGKTYADYIYISAFHGLRLIKDSTKGTYTIASRKSLGSKFTLPQAIEYLRELGAGWTGLTASKYNLLTHLFTIVTCSMEFYNNYAMFRGHNSTINVNNLPGSTLPNNVSTTDINGVNYYNAMFLGIDNLFGTPVFYFGKNTLPSLDGDNSKCRIIVAATGPYIETMLDEPGDNYVDYNVETYRDIGDGKSRTTISDLVIIDNGMSIFTAKYQLYDETVNQTGSTLNQYIPQTTSLYSVFGAYDGLVTALQYRTDGTTTFPTFLTYS